MPSVVDVCAELPFRGQARRYRSVPMPDLATPSPEALHRAADAIAHARRHGEVLVCCALGYSRSAAAVATWLRRSGHADSADAAIALVAAADYWRRDALRRYLIHAVFNGVLIERDAAKRHDDPIACLCRAVDEGNSLILFPEGTRNTEEGVLPFKSGIYHLARQRPELEFVPGGSTTSSG